MSYSKEDRQYILNEHLKLISRISDKEYQIRIWIHAEGPECQSIDDVVCDFFDMGDFILKTLPGIRHYR